MSILERSASRQAPAAEWRPHSDELRVITAGRVGNMEAQLETSGFDVVAVAETEDALIDAVSADEPDAVVVEADLCASLERVRDLAPDAVLIVVGDHTPAGALGRIERGVSGTVMAGLLRALVAEGVGAAVAWGLVPAFRPAGGLHVPQRMMGSLMSAKADLVRAYLASAFRGHAELVAAAGTAAVTVSASLLLTLSAPRTHERPERVLVPAPAVERAPQHPVAAVSPTTQLPVAAVSPTTRTPGHGPSRNEGAPGDRWGPNRGGSSDQGLHDDQGEDQDNNDQGKDEGNDDQGEDQDNNDQGKDEGNDDQGED
jgi:DNA-binding NarL/FixJ family response regulator